MTKKNDGTLSHQTVGEEDNKIVNRITKFYNTTIKNFTQGVTIQKRNQNQ